MQNIHQSLADGRWFTLSLAEQLGNVGSEYERALRWKQRDETHFQNALDRLLELLDLTISDKRWRNHRLKELVRLREVVCEEFCGDKRWGDSDLRSYFLYFGILARSDR